MQVFSNKEGVSACFIRNNRFKSRLLSIRFMLPLKKETATENAMAAELISSCSEKYPEPSVLEKELKRLYGADISSAVEKIGDNQVITIYARSISDELGIDDMPFSCLLNIFYSMLSKPKTVGESFRESDTERIKRIWKEKLASRENEKRIFAKERMEALLFEGEAYGNSPYGSLDVVENATPESLYRAFHRLMDESAVRITLTAPEYSEEKINDFLSLFKGGKRHKFQCAEIKENREKIEKTEKMNITQGKLVLGFRLPIMGSDRETAAIAVMGDIFGGGTYSKLFSVVREKMSLCYYCSARTYRRKGLMEVESGVNDENAEKAKLAILEQLEELQKGNFEDETLNSSILSICESLNSSADKISTEDGWYGSRMHEELPLSPKQFAELIKEVSREDVINAAKGVRHIATYLLKGEDKK